MESLVEAFGVVSAAVGFHRLDAIAESAHPVVKGMDVGDVIVVTVAVGHHSEADVGVRGEPCHLLGNGAEGGLYPVDLIRHVAGGVEEEEDVQSHALPVVHRPL